MRPFHQRALFISLGVAFLVAATGILWTTLTTAPESAKPSEDTVVSGEIVVDQPLMTGALQSYDDVQAMFSEPIMLQLATGKRNLVQWANELEKTTPTTPKELWTKYNVCILAGRNETAIQLLPVLRDLLESVPMHSQGSYDFHSRYGRIYDPIRNPHETRKNRLELYIPFYDVFAPVYCYDLPTWEFKQAGWSNSQISTWLRKHYDSAVAYKPIQTNWSWASFEHTSSSPYISDVALEWQGRYMEHLSLWSRESVYSLSGEEQIAAEAKLNQRSVEEWNRLSADAEKNPDDMAKLSLLFSAMGASGYLEWGTVFPKLDWLTETLDQRNGFEAWFIAKNLTVGISRNWNVDKIRNDYLEVSVPFWHRALDLSLTDEQCKQIHEENSRWNAIPAYMLEPQDNERTRAIFRAKGYDSLNTTLLALNRTEEAQTVMEAGRAFRKEHGIETSTGLVLAGMTQAASGYRVVEAEILAREPNEDDAEKSEADKFNEQTTYWMERAEYYRGRREWEQREDALRRGLALFTTPELRTIYARSFEGYYQALLDFYREQERKDDVVKLFHEIDTLLAEETRSPNAFYSPFISTLKYFGEEQIIYDKWRKDVEKCVTQMKETTGRNELSLMSQNLVWLMGAAEVNNRPAFKLDNTDPLWWEVLRLMERNHQHLLEVLVLQVDEFYNSSRKITFDEKAYEKAKAILLEKNDAAGLREFAWILQEKHAKFALQLYEAALERAKEQSEQSMIHTGMFETLMQLGDWQRAEKVLDAYISGDFPESDYIINGLKRLRQSAEKAGATRDAKRFQQRLENLGVQF